MCVFGGVDYRREVKVNGGKGGKRGLWGKIKCCNVFLLLSLY